MNSSLIPCWYINENDKQQRINNKKPLGDFPTSDRFMLINRIDNTFIEGAICRAERGNKFVNDVNDRLSYLIDFLDKKKVYFTFDRINLYQLIEWFPNHPDPIKFILKRLDTNISNRSNQAFMIMPFHFPETDNFYLSQIKSYLNEKLGMEIYRADDFRNNDIIIHTIYKLIEESEIIIADTTLDNKNAFYELGYAAAMQKEIITIQNKKAEQKLFFDRAHIRTILYDIDNPESFHFDLKSTIESIRKRI